MRSPPPRLEPSCCCCCCCGSACAISAISFLVMALPKELKFHLKMIPRPSARHRAFQRQGADMRFLHAALLSRNRPGLNTDAALGLSMTPEPTCGAPDLERSIDVSLSVDLDGYELDCQRPRSQSICRCELFCSDSGRTKA
jgi:hypothetical protein